MQACLSKKDRSPFSTTSLEKGYKASDAEKAQCFNEYLSYAGYYRVQEDQVIHSVQLSLNPSIVGSELKRFYRFEGETLVLFYDVSLPSGLCCHYTLSWRQAHAPPFSQAPGKTTHRR